MTFLTPARTKLLCAAAALAPLPLAAAEADEKNEYGMKAKFLCSFTEYVQWPAGAVPAKGDPFLLGVLSEDAFGGELDRGMKSKSVRTRMAIRRSRKTDDMKDCHVVFVCRSEKERVAEILASLRHGPILLVGETEGFAKAGGAIGFVTTGGKVTFEVNQASARRSGLVLSSRLLKLAKLVNE